MTSAVCGWCNIHSKMELVGSPVSHWVDYETRETRVMATQQCDNCIGLSLSYAELLEDETYDLPPSADRRMSTEYVLAVQNDRLNWLPPAKAKVELSHVPKHVAAAAREAHTCNSLGARRAAVQLARSVVEATAKDKGITIKGIHPKIEDLHKQGFIRQHVKEAAHEIRYLGNDMAHGDFMDPVEKEDADLVLTLMTQVLVEVYEDPGNVADARARRAAKQQKGGGQA